MKKLLYLFVVFFLFSACQKQIVPSKSRAFYQVNVGSTANDGTGTTIRQAFQWQNSNWSAQTDTNKIDRDSLAVHRTAIQNRYTKDQIKEVINDTIEARLNDATDINTIVDAKIDSIVGVGANVSLDKLQFIVGTTTGAPANGDSILTHASIAGKEVSVYRGTTGDLHKQYYNLTATNGKTGFRFTSSTGTVTVRPTFATGDRVLVEATDPIAVTWLTLSGGESTLLTNLVAGWQLNETSGSTVYDVKSTYNSTISNVTMGGAGKFGSCAIFDAASDKITGPTTGLELTTFSVSLWVKTSSTPPDDPRLLISKRILGPNRGFSIAQMDATNNIVFYVFNSVYGYAAVFTSGTIADGNWHNVICTYDGSANLRVYIDGSEDANSPEAWTYAPDYAAGTTPFYIGNSLYGTDGFIGSMDDIYIWDKVLSSQERTDLQTKTYPFN